jgi:hypothetical protein
VYRVTEERVSIVKKNNKRFIAIDATLAQEAEDQYEGGTLRELVEHLLQSYISEGVVLNNTERVKELQEMV